MHQIIRAEKSTARIGRSTNVLRVPQTFGAPKEKEKPLTFVSGLMVEVTGLEPVTLCRLADDEPGCNREKEKALTFVSA